MVYKVRDLMVNVIRASANSGSTSLPGLAGAAPPFVHDLGCSEAVTATVDASDPISAGASVEKIGPALPPYVQKTKTLLRVEDLALLKRRLIHALDLGDRGNSAAVAPSEPRV